MPTLEEREVAYEEGAGKRKLMRPVKKIRKHQSQLAEIIRGARRDVAKIEAEAVTARGLGEAELTAQVVQERIAGRRAQMNAEVEAVEAEVNANLNLVKETVKTSDPTDPAAVIAREAQATRVWNRLQVLLDDGRDPRQVIADYRGDPQALAVLEQELPVWLDVNERSVEKAPLLDEIGDYKVPLLPQDQQDAHDVLAEAEKSHLTARTNLSIAKTEGIDAVLLVGDEEGDAIHLGGAGGEATSGDEYSRIVIGDRGE